MTDTPMTVQCRPFAIEPITDAMLPDGIFDNAIHRLRIACHYTNSSGSDLTDVTLYLESVGDPGVVVAGHTFWFATIPAGASVLVSWEADFQAASPGKPLVSFIAQAAGFAPFRTIQQIFIAQTRYDAVAEKWTCTVPEGTLELSGLTVIQPGESGWWPVIDPRTGRGPYRLVVPTGALMTWLPNPAYPGQHGELPFADPWWKVLAALIAWLIGTIVIVTTHNGSGDSTVTGGAQGNFDETDPSADCCTPTVSGSGSGELGKKVAGWTAGVAVVTTIAGALGDEADPWWRGQLATSPAPAELTTSEQVKAQWSFLEPLAAGKPGRFDVRWDYLRLTTGGAYPHGVAEVRSSVHIADPITIHAPAVVHTGQPLWVTATMTRPDQTLFRGPDAYAVAVFEAPQGLGLLVAVCDDGIGFDSTQNDGGYTGGIAFGLASRLVQAAGQKVYGRWQVYLFAQDVNRVLPGLPPEVAAQTIGGVPIVSPFTITFGTGPCPLAAHAAIDVVP